MRPTPLSSTSTPIDAEASTPAPRRSCARRLAGALFVLALAACGGGGGGGGTAPQTFSWGVAALIETDNAGSATNPQMTVSAGGNALAVWAQDDGMRYNIWANRYE